MRFTQAQFEAYQNRHNALSRAAEGAPVHFEDVEREKTLQDQIEADLRQRGWPFVRTRMDRATTFTLPGVPDYVIAAPGGRTLWLENKSRTGKQTAEQRGFQMMLERVGHEYFLVRSFAEYLNIFHPPK